MNKIYINRDIESVLKKVSRDFPAIAITGPRQSGKSTMLKRIFSDTYKYITFDDPIIREQAFSDPKLFLEDIGRRVIIDEIQYVPQILSYIKMIIDDNREEKGQYIFTGSQQFNLIKDLGDSLAGRIALLNLLPFSIKEKKSIKTKSKKLDSSLKCFIDACLSGSFPEVNVNKNIDVETWYSSYLSTYLERDVRTLYNIGNLRDFQSFMQLLASRCSQILNLSSFANDLGISVNTIKKWLSVLEASKIIFILPSYYQNLGKRIIKSPKIYFLDCGLVSYLVGVKTKDLLLKGPMASALFENFCIQETVKAFVNQGRRPSLYYCRFNNNLEIDIIIEESSNKISIFEIKFSKTPKRKMSENLEKFRKISKKTQILKSNLITLSDDDIKLTNHVSSLGVSSYLEQDVKKAIEDVRKRVNTFFS